MYCLCVSYLCYRLRIPQEFYKTTFSPNNTHLWKYPTFGGRVFHTETFSPLCCLQKRNHIAKLLPCSPLKYQEKTEIFKDNTIKQSHNYSSNAEMMQGLFAVGFKCFLFHILFIMWKFYNVNASTLLTESENPRVSAWPMEAVSKPKKKANGYWLWDCHRDFFQQIRPLLGKCWLNIERWGIVFSSLWTVCSEVMHVEGKADETIYCFFYPVARACLFSIAYTLARFQLFELKISISDACL